MRTLVSLGETPPGSKRSSTSKTAVDLVREGECRFKHEANMLHIF